MTDRSYQAVDRTTGRAEQALALATAVARTPDRRRARPQAVVAVVTGRGPGGGAGKRFSVRGFELLPVRA